MPTIDEYREAMRAYEMGVAKFLGIDARKCFDLRESAEHGRLHLTWRAVDGPQQAEPRGGRAETPWSMFAEDEQVTWFGGVALDDTETARFRAEVGDRPTLLTPEQRRTLDRLEYLRSVEDGA